jgi:hypothetical protein
MKALLISAAAGLAMGAAAGIVLQLPPPVETPLAYDFQTAAFTEDPGVQLHRAVMAGRSWEAPQPYIPVTYPPLSDPDPIPELADLSLDDLRVPYVSPVTSSEAAAPAVLQPVAVVDHQPAAATAMQPTLRMAAIQVAAVDRQPVPVAALQPAAPLATVQVATLAP